MNGLACPGLGLLLCLLCVLPLAAQTVPPATDFEWELQVANRTLFRDRVPVGQIALSAEQKSGFFGTRKKSGTEALRLWVEVAFVPGDTARYLAVAFEWGDRSAVAASALLDASEIPSLYRSVDYVLSTAQRIAGTERTDTRIVYRSKSALEFTFLQKGKSQTFEIRFPARASREQLALFLDRPRLSLLKDVLDLTLFELKRQGAALPPAQN